LGEASNSGIIYFGTHGGGFYKTGSLVGVDDDFGPISTTEKESMITVYPNPVRDQGSMKVTVNDPNNAQIFIYSLSGNLMKTLHPYLEAGDNAVSFNVSDLPAGNYIVQLKDGNTSKVSKFVKMN
jgi:hypothetical protein